MQCVCLHLGRSFGCRLLSALSVHGLAGSVVRLSIGETQCQDLVFLNKQASCSQHWLCNCQRSARSATLARSRAVRLDGHTGGGGCRELGFEVIEVNASDTRNKADGQATVKAGIAGKLANSIKELTTNTAIGMGADGRSKRVTLRRTLFGVCSTAGVDGWS